MPSQTLINRTIIEVIQSLVKKHEIDPRRIGFEASVSAMGLLPMFRGAKIILIK